nr:hypothetical protein [Tanacetum cinerariifolium]
SDPRVPLNLGRPFLRTVRALTYVHEEEMILHDGDERLTLNMKHDTSSYSNQPQEESINMINIYNDSCEDYLKDLFGTNHLSGNPTFSSHIDLTSPKVINPLSGNPTSSSPNHLLKEFSHKLALITFPLRNDDLPFDIESDLREIEYLLNHDPTKEMDYILEDSIDECNLVDPNDNLFDTIPRCSLMNILLIIHLHHYMMIPFLRTVRALTYVHEEEMILHDGDERLTLNMKHDTSSYSNQPQEESINMINIYNDSCEDYLKDLFGTNHLSGNPTFSSHIDLTSPKVINPLSGNPTSSSPNHLLKEFSHKLALITFPLRNDDLPFDIESDLREIEYLL